MKDDKVYVKTKFEFDSFRDFFDEQNLFLIFTLLFYSKTNYYFLVTD